MYIEVGPRYGRDYPSGKAALRDWDANKDFTVLEGAQYGVAINKADAESIIPEDHIVIRYSNNERTVRVPDKKKP